MNVPNDELDQGLRLDAAFACGLVGWGSVARGLGRLTRSMYGRLRTGFSPGPVPVHSFIRNLPALVTPYRRKT